MMRDLSENVDEGEKEEEDEWPIITQTLYDIQRNVRAPKGFFGMRGKKEFTNAEKRALMGVQQVCHMQILTRIIVTHNFIYFFDLEF